MATIRNPDQTRATLIQAAFDEIYQHGYQGMRIDSVLERTGFKKGALYHHFASKADIGYAVIDELLVNMMREQWLLPLKKYDDPVDGLKKTILSVGSNDIDDIMKNGCPLNNLAQEMSALDDGFQQRLNNIFQLWIQGVADSLAEGQKDGYVRSDIDCKAAATFIVSSLEGASGLLKASQDINVLQLWWPGMEQFLESLRPTSN